MNIFNLLSAFGVNYFTHSNTLTISKDWAYADTLKQNYKK